MYHRLESVFSFRKRLLKVPRMRRVTTEKLKALLSGMCAIFFSLLLMGILQWFLSLQNVEK